MVTTDRGESGPLGPKPPRGLIINADPFIGQGRRFAEQATLTHGEKVTIGPGIRLLLSSVHALCVWRRSSLLQFRQ